jgi:hypothetical protein
MYLYDEAMKNELSPVIEYMGFGGIVFYSFFNR